RDRGRCSPRLWVWSWSFILRWQCAFSTHTPSRLQHNRPRLYPISRHTTPLHSSLGGLPIRQPSLQAT
ncbi:hypothetical protein H4R20_005714, partial [Coemansia guatemalensis]